MINFSHKDAKMDTSSDLAVFVNCISRDCRWRKVAACIHFLSSPNKRRVPVGWDASEGRGWGGYVY